MKSHNFNQDLDPFHQDEDDCDTCELLGATIRQIYTGDEKTVESSDYIMDDPPDIVGIGNAGWTLLHSIAAYYPSNPTEAKKETTKSFLSSFGSTFPCDYCGNGFLNYMDKSPPRLNDQFEFSQWMCEAHNDVNQKLGKPLFDCAFVDKRWKMD